MLFSIKPRKKSNLKDHSQRANIRANYINTHIDTYIYYVLNIITRGFDNSVLVRLGGIAMALPIRETLHHLPQLAWAFSLTLLLEF